MINTSTPVRSPMLHSAVRIYTWVCFALATQVMHGIGLGLMAALVILWAIKSNPARFFLMLRKTRWIMVTIFLVYAYVGPGEALWSQLGIFSPLAEGWQAGLVQLLRLIVILASLSLLLSSLTSAQLVSGLHKLLLPLACFGGLRETFSVRLALTIHYAEKAMLNKVQLSHSTIEQGMQPLPVALHTIELESKPFYFIDWIILALASLALLGVFL